MVNGVLMIVAAVLFAVIALGKEMNMLWLCTAGVYLVAGLINLIVFAVKNRKKRKAAEAEASKAG
ncbi:MAG: hypothetical protein IKJ99_09300 [Oscillospiraceae bacterium]|nr:hypothetical protein [Oscillospiraceae bacterium]